MSRRHGVCKDDDYKMTRNASGFALIDLVFVCGIIGVLASISIPRLTTAKDAANAASAIGSMRAINSGQLTFALTCAGGFYAPNLTTLGTAPAGSNEPFLNGGLGAANTVTKAGYIIQISATGYGGSPASCNGLAAGSGGQGFKGAADPISSENPRFFATNADGLIYQSSSSLFTQMPETGKSPGGVSIH
jgi:type IV pilus assembly protein PilA